MAVAHGFGLPVGRLAGRYTDTAPKQSLCCFSSVSEQQMAVAHGFGLPVGRLAGCYTDTAPKQSLCYFSSVSE